MTLNLEAGYSWFNVKSNYHDSRFIGLASFEKRLEHDRFTIRVAKEYQAQFTSDRYGTYYNTSGSVSWEKALLKGWTSTVRYSIENIKPTGNTRAEEETDTNGTFIIAWSPVEQFELDWKPISYFLISLNYEHLETDYETSGTARENRYRVVTEVRF